MKSGGFMKLNFIINDYMIGWNILFQASISEVIHKHKMKLWKIYQKEYTKLEKDNIKILREENDFIPDDDTIYNLMLESDYYPIFKRESEKHRVYLMKTWDKYKRRINTFMKETIRIPMTEEFDVFVTHPMLDVVSYIPKANKYAFVWGRHNDNESDVKTVIDLVHFVLRAKLGDFRKEYRDIVDAVLELAITNELYTRLSGKSRYLDGNSKLKALKRKLYPYWLMYLGADKEDLVKYMRRDSIAFDINCYTVEAELKKVDLYDFIDFCIKNRKYISRISEKEVI